MSALQDAVLRLPPEIQRRIALFVNLDLPVDGGWYSPGIILFKRTLSDRTVHRQMRLRAGIPTTKQKLKRNTLGPVGYDSLKQEMSKFGISRSGWSFLDVHGRPCLYLSIMSGNSLPIITWLKSYGLLKCCEWYRVPAQYYKSYEPALHTRVRDYVFVLRLWPLARSGLARKRNAQVDVSGWSS